MSAYHLSPHLVMIPRPRRSDMLAASQLFLVFILAPSWSLSDHGRTNARPASVPKSRLCPFDFGGYAVDFRRGMPSLPFIGWAHLHLHFRRGSRALGAESSELSDPCLRSEFRGRGAKPPEPMYLRQRLAKRVFVHADTLVPLTPFSAQFAHDARGQILVNFKGGFQL